MDNFDLRKYLYNNPLLTEIKVNQPGITKEKFKELCNKFDDNNWGVLRDILRSYNEKWLKIEDWIKIASQEEINKAYRDIKQYFKDNQD